MPSRYANYTTSDFDNFDCLKLSKGIYFILLFVLRGYLVWIMTLTNMNDRVAIIQWFYPEPSFFYLSLFSGLIGLYAVVVISLRRPGASQWIRKSWNKMRGVLVLSLSFDLLVNVLGYFYWQLHSLPWLMLNALLVAGFVWYLKSNERLKINIEEFPEKLPEK